ncbi:hypothetical protein DCS_00012 [Drechmeria coniospora]|uniref:ABC transporter n=1 Tax=Drechmeria coniospora TaxID=98403 RepID=A0A151GP44_DRECN|nr:hypothetical protein DCS_00012 [Drechmeria coniospora]KYK58885.1 hypothetical protein DCS_00012 [Drechmeria coniospora]
MPCSIDVQDDFGPAVAAADCNDGFDFTLLFEQLCLSILPAAVFAVLGPARLWQLLRRPPICRPASLCRFKLVGASPSSAPARSPSDSYSLPATHAAFLAVQLAHLVLLLVPGAVPRTRASIPAEALVLCVALLCVALSRVEHVRSVRPSTLLLLYLGLAFFFDLVRARTFWAVDGYRVLATVFSVGLAFKLAAFVAECLEKQPGEESSALYRGRSRETAGNVFARGLFCWLNPLLWQGFRTVLHVPGLLGIDPELGTPDRHRRVWARWQRSPLQTAGALVKLVISAHRQSILQGVLPRLALSGFTFAQPFLITRIIHFATAPGGPDGKLDVQVGNGLVVATAIIYVGLAVANANAQHKTYRVITRLRGSFISLLYRKTLRVSMPTAQESSAVTLMSADIERTGSGLRFMHEVWASPVDLALGFYLLQRELGPAAAAPGVLFLLCSAAGLRVAASMGRRQRLWLESIQHRIKVTSDSLSAMKEVRMGGLQARVESQLEGLRRKEIDASRPFKNALALIVCLSYTTAAMGPVFSFGIYSLLAKKNNTRPLTADTGFTALAVFSLLRTPMAMILDSVAGLVGSLGAMRRIGEYMATDNHLPPRHDDRPSSVRLPHEVQMPEKFVLPLLEWQTRATLPMPSPSPSIVTATQYSAGWDQDRGYVLQDLTFSVPRGSLTFVVGPVGCGKSTLLCSMLGETVVSKGDLRVAFDRAAYVGQSPWLTNDTIQNNIIGTGALNKGWYDQVVDACALRHDIDGMPRHDQEMVDSGGSNLSGGQQARLGLARAVYSRHQVVLLDDVMSGLDTRTEEAVFRNLLGPDGLLRGGKTTTVFATNAVHRLSAGDHIVVLSTSGNIVEQGPYDELWTITKHDQADRKDHALADEFARQRHTAARRDARQVSDSPATGTQRRTGDLTVYMYYARAVGSWNFGLFIGCGALFVFALLFPQYLMRWWAEENERQAHGKLGRYLGAYFGLACLALLGLGAGCLQLVVRMMPRASATFHTTLLRTTMDAPLSLFSGSAVGDTINRFSQDLQLIDMELPLALFNTSIELLSSIGNLAVIAIAARYIGAALPAVLITFFVVQVFYLRTARQLRLLDIEAKAPLISHFLETLSGLAAIRAYGAEEDYERRCMERLDHSQKPSYLLYCVQRWLNLVLDLIVAGIAVVFVTIAVKTRGRIEPGLVGTALVGIVNFSVSIKALLENWTNLETCVGAVSRVRSFAAESKSEHRAGEIQVPPESWPVHGRIVYDDVTATWEEKGDQPVVKDISLVIEPGQKLAICGRTGSGKSSLIATLFRLLEPQAGTMSVDGVNLGSLPRQEVRQRLICVPQAPFLLSGTVRGNVDPFGVASDEEITKALGQVRMLEAVNDLGGLDGLLDGDGLSVGQRQLLCLARATLRRGSILVLDEATASLDWDTETIVREVIQTVFRTHTVITIAHRIWSILDYDRVAVISHGRVAEYGSPRMLLEDPTSMFSQLHRASAGHPRTNEEDDDEAA